MRVAFLASLALSTVEDGSGAIFLSASLDPLRFKVQGTRRRLLQFPAQGPRSDSEAISFQLDLETRRGVGSGGKNDLPCASRAFFVLRTALVMSKARFIPNVTERSAEDQN